MIWFAQNIVVKVFNDTLIIAYVCLLIPFPFNPFICVYKDIRYFINDMVVWKAKWWKDEHWSYKIYFKWFLQLFSILSKINNLFTHWYHNSHLVIFILSSIHFTFTHFNLEIVSSLDITSNPGFK